MGLSRETLGGLVLSQRPSVAPAGAKTSMLRSRTGSSMSLRTFTDKCTRHPSFQEMVSSPKAVNLTRLVSFGQAQSKSVFIAAPKSSMSMFFTKSIWCRKYIARLLKRNCCHIPTIAHAGGGNHANSGQGVARNA